MSARVDTATTTHSYGTLCVIALTLTLLKLFLVHDNEIVAIPYDAWGYVSLASSTSPWETLGPLPGYPIWLWASRFSGLPQRIAIELFISCCAFVFASGLGLRVAGRLGFVVAYFIVIFSPATYYLFDMTLSDGFFAGLSVAAAGVISKLILESDNRANYRSFLFLGVILGTMQITRRETPIVAIVIASTFLALLTVDLRIGTSFRRSMALQVSRIAACAVVVGAITGAAMACHYSANQVWALSATDLPSHLGMLKRLASIETSEQSRRFIPISKKARELAYANSQTLQKFEKIVENPENLYQRASKSSIGLPGEIGAGWIWHVFGAAAYELGFTTPAGLDAVYKTINGELDDAFSRGRLQRNFVIHPLIVADASVWLPFLPASIGRVMLASTQAIYPVKDQQFDKSLFDRVALRRSSLAEQKFGAVKGWAFVEPAAAEMVEVGSFDKDNHFVVQSRGQRFPRPDVQDGYRKLAMEIPLATGFIADTITAEAPALRVRVSLPSGQSAISEPLVVGGVQSVRFPDQSSVATIGTDAVPQSPTQFEDTLSGSLKQFGIHLYRKPGLWYLCIVVWTVVLGLQLIRTFAATSAVAMRYVLLVAVLFVWLASRVLMYAVLDAAAWEAEPRYVSASGLLFLGIAAVLASSLISGRNRIVFRRDGDGKANLLVI